jgi:hypothetical protein
MSVKFFLDPRSGTLPPIARFTDIWWSGIFKDV